MPFMFFLCKSISCLNKCTARSVPYNRLVYPQFVRKIEIYDGVEAEPRKSQARLGSRKQV